MTEITLRRLTSVSIEITFLEDSTLLKTHHYVSGSGLGFMF